VDGPVGAALTDLGSISATFATSTGLAIVEIGPDPGVTAVAAIEIARQGTHWVARAAGRAYTDGLAVLARDCGLRSHRLTRVRVPILRRWRLVHC